MGGTVYRVVKSQDYATIATYHLRDKRLTLAAKGLMSVLMADEGDTAYTIADLTERSLEGRDAIRSALKKLEDCGYIRKWQLHGEGGRFGSNEVLIYESPLAGNLPTAAPLSASPFTENPTTVKPSAGEPLAGNLPTAAPAAELALNHSSGSTSRGGSSKKRGNKEDIKNPPTSPPGDGPKWKPERFAAFWKYYKDELHRGQSKRAAIRAWDKLKPDDALIDTIARALQRQLKTDEWQRGIGIPYASTYLNQRRWEDDIGPRRDAASAASPDVVFWDEGMEL